MKRIIKKILDNAFLGYLFSCLVIFIITIPTSSFTTAIVGSLFFGLLAMPITAFVLALIDSLLPQ